MVDSIEVLVVVAIVPFVPGGLARWWLYVVVRLSVVRRRWVRISPATSTMVVIHDIRWRFEHGRGRRRKEGQGVAIASMM